jgi:hypothetical protein
MKRKHKSTKYSRRERDFAFMGFVKGMLCSAIEEWPDVDVPPGDCEGEVEADHAGARGLSQKCPDNECIPLCALHHRQRTDHSGAFRTLTRDQARAWRARAILRTQTLYRESQGGE